MTNPETVKELRTILNRTGVKVTVTSTVLLGGGISFKVSKADVLEYLKGKDDHSLGYGGAEVYFDEDTNTVYI